MSYLSLPLSDGEPSRRTTTKLQAFKNRFVFLKFLIKSKISVMLEICKILKTRRQRNLPQTPPLRSEHEHLVHCQSLICLLYFMHLLNCRYYRRSPVTSFISFSISCLFLHIFQRFPYKTFLGHGLCPERSITDEHLKYSGHFTQSSSFLTTT